MADLGIPGPYRPSLIALARLSDDAARHLIDAIQRAEPLLSIEDLEGLARGALPPAAQGDAERLISAVLSLRGGQLRYTPTDRVAELVSESADLDALSADERRQLRERLEPLLGSGAIATTANALELLTQHERNYRAGRVLTDVRYAFPEDAAARPTGAVITEILQLQTWDRDGSAETLYVAMDEADLRDLRSVLDRAIAKTRTLALMLEEQGITYFKIDERGL